MLRNVGNSFSQFGWAYGLFALTSALVYPLVGKMSDRVGDQKLLIIYAWSMAILMLCFPIATEVWHVYILQIVMGVLGAVQRNTEKTSLARKVVQENAGYEIGKYHVDIDWRSSSNYCNGIFSRFLYDWYHFLYCIYLICSEWDCIK